MKGYKTYVCSVLGIIDVLGMALGYINEGVGLAVLGMLGFGSIAALRSAISTEVATLVGKQPASTLVQTEQQS